MEWIGECDRRRHYAGYNVRWRRYYARWLWVRPYEFIAVVNNIYFTVQTKSATFFITGALMKFWRWPTLASLFCTDTQRQCVARKRRWWLTIWTRCKWRRCLWIWRRPECCSSGSGAPSASMRAQWKILKLTLRCRTLLLIQARHAPIGPSYRPLGNNPTISYPHWEFFFGYDFACHDLHSFSTFKWSDLM